MQHSTFEISLMQANCLREMWMKETFETSSRQTWMATLNAISLPVWVSGPWHCALPVGATRSRSGQVHAPVNLSARRARALGFMTSGTYGQTGTGSLGSVALKRSLENRLQALTVYDGPTLYRLTWKHRTTPSGLSIPALRASGHTTFAKGSTSQPKICDLPQVGWSTPMAHEARLGYQKRWGGKAGSQKSLTTEVIDGLDAMRGDPTLSGWTTPAASDATRAGTGITANMTGSSLTQLSQMAGWATPKTADATSGADYARKARGAGGPDVPTQAAIAGWPTPMASERNSSPETMAKRLAFRKGNGQNSVPLYLNEVAKLAGPHRLTLDGKMLTGCSAGMKSGGQLHPAHSRWLMRIPDAWESCAPTETPSILAKRRHLFVPTWKEDWQT